MRCTVLGAGSWGTALGRLLADKGDEVRMWDIDAGPLTTISEKHENSRYLPGVVLPPTMVGEPDLARALDEAELVIMAVPSFAMRSAAQNIADKLPDDVLLCSVTKGVEVDTLMTMHEVLKDVLPQRYHHGLACLSGPSFAVDVAHEMPTAVTVAAESEEVAVRVQEAFYSTFFRPYTSTDVMGVELGGCTKNVIAIATGFAVGRGVTTNGTAALMTRGLAETSALAARRGGLPETMQGLSGFGDLFLTCSSTKSRNYRVGFALGSGRTLEDIQAELGQVAEGVHNAKSVHLMAAEYDVPMPVSQAVYGLIYEGTPPEAVLPELLGIG
ncbi:MAG: NAD(P)-dependent glycerol-3-phosphate dehydrogenase [Austwickia sp.]|nr:NAD(P)-dependent glycerol-3-phosphate dehydrogenase [Actinomycetota bacterium]MCB1252883.1 NAD(P)-dependent glycerol-3-phosphate dehydrogenase [Austwickia sp.]MCO5310246.1 NAD(P)-dependent glycerol-3-phosphate dehydrogenase [Austwickia sp.]